MRSFALRCSGVVGGLLLATSAHASFHLMQVEQVIGGVNGDVTAQAIQLRERSAGQNFTELGRLVVRDAAGNNPIVLMDLNAPVFGDLQGNRILIASPNMANYLTVAPDFTMTNLIPASYLAAGTLTWEQDSPALVYWRVSWGGAGYTGVGTVSTLNDANGNSNPAFATALPSTSMQALQFKFTAGTLSIANSTDYQVTAGAATFIDNEAISGVVGSGVGTCSALYGVDLFTTPTGTAAIDLSGNLLPGGFFGPGSDPFGGTITLKGAPIDPTLAGPLGPTDTIVRRDATASIGPGGTAAVPIEIVALSLQSVAPITVTYSGGSPEQWDVQIVLSNTIRQNRGTMQILQNGCSCAEGGTFSATLPVLPRLMFTRTLPSPATADYDYPTQGLPPIVFSYIGGWQPSNPGVALASLANPVLVEQDGDPGTLPISTGVRSSNFFPGFRAARCESTGCASSPTNILRTLALSAGSNHDLLALAEVGATDTDADGVADDADNCPNFANPFQLDSDGDGIGDGCDNCPTTKNFCQEDANHDNIGDACQTVSVGPVAIGARVVLGRLAPNPVTAALAFAVTVPRELHVVVSVYDIRGRRVATVIDQTLPAGEHSLSWNARRAGLGTGSYFLRLEAGGTEQTRKFSVLR